MVLSAGILSASNCRRRVARGPWPGRPGAADEGVARLDAAPSARRALSSPTSSIYDPLREGQRLRAAPTRFSDPGDACTRSAECLIGAERHRAAPHSGASSVEDLQHVLVPAFGHGGQHLPGRWCASRRRLRGPPACRSPGRAARPFRGSESPGHSSCRSVRRKRPAGGGLRVDQQRRRLDRDDGHEVRPDVNGQLGRLAVLAVMDHGRAHWFGPGPASAC